MDELLQKTTELLEDLTDVPYVVEETEDEAGPLVVVTVMEAILEAADYAVALGKMSEQVSDHSECLPYSYLN